MIQDKYSVHTYHLHCYTSIQLLRFCEDSCRGRHVSILLLLPSSPLHPFPQKRRGAEPPPFCVCPLRFRAFAFFSRRSHGHGGCGARRRRQEARARQHRLRGRPCGRRRLVVGLPKDDDGDLGVSHVVGDGAVGLPDVGAAVRNFLRNREVGEFVSGALAGAMTKAVLAPLETIRTRMVVGVGSKQIFGSFVEIVEQNGWQGLWAGNTINMLRIIPTQAIELGTFECVKRSMTEAQEKWKEDGCPKIQIGNLKVELPLHLLSPIAIGGAAAGIVSTLVCHPLEVLKDRLTVNHEAYPSIGLAFNKIYRTDGIGGLYAGLCPTLVGMLPYSTCYYFMYETIKTSYCRAHKKKSLSRPELLIIGALSGLTASTISFPLEVARKRLMVGALQGKCPPHMIAALAEVFQEEGLKGLYRGWAASSLKVMPTSGITWMFYEAWKDILLAPQLHT